MSNVRRASVVVVVVAALIGGSAVASGASKPLRGQATRAQGTGVKVYTSLRQVALLDLGQPGFTLGDQDIFSDDVLTKKNGARVGVDGGVCTVVRVTNATARSGLDQCLITFSLKRGQITTQVLQPSGQATGTATGVITGGTGAYRNAHGVYRVTFRSAVAADVTFSFAT